MTIFGKQFEKIIKMTQERVPVIISKVQKTQNHCVAILAALLQQL